MFSPKKDFVYHCLHLDDLRLQLSWQLCLSQSPIFVQSKKRFCILTFSSRVCNYHTVYTPAILSVCHINSSKYAYQVICDAILKRWVKKAHLFAAVLSQLSLMLYAILSSGGCRNHMGVEHSYCNRLAVLYHSDLVCIPFVLLYNCGSMKIDWPSTYDLNVSLYNHVSQAVLQASLLKSKKKCNQTKESGRFSLKRKWLARLWLYQLYLIVVILPIIVINNSTGQDMTQNEWTVFRKCRCMQCCLENTTYIYS